MSLMILVFLHTIYPGSLTKAGVTYNIFPTSSPLSLLILPAIMTRGVWFCCWILVCCRWGRGFGCAEIPLIEALEQ